MSYRTLKFNESNSNFDLINLFAFQVFLIVFVIALIGVVMGQEEDHHEHDHHDHGTSHVHLCELISLKYEINEMRFGLIQGLNLRIILET